jgi:probable selenium-dependent hydroxylase accessory protein YqeC
MPSLSRALELKRGDAAVLTGGGGKSSLLFALAAENPFDRILCTTSTKMFDPRPAGHPFDRVLIPWEGPGLPEAQAGRERCFIASELVPGQSRKVNGLSNNSFRHWKEQKVWPILIIEADGAAGKPLKAAAMHEPVIPDCATVQIACIGLDVLGKPLNGKWVHRPELVSERSGLRMGRNIGPDDLKALILHEEGVFKGCGRNMRRILFLNKTDALDPAWKVGEIAEALSTPGMKIVTASLAVPPPFA